MKVRRFTSQFWISMLFISASLLILNLNGCMWFQKKEAAVDTELSKPAPAPNQASMAPEEPQPGFAQEPTGTKNT